jgi:hypothetical protein
MNPDNLLLVMTLFVIVSAIALLIQAGLLFGIYRNVKSVRSEVASVMPQVRSIITKAEDTIDQSRKHVIEITAKANEMMDVGKAQLVKLDAVLTDASTRARAQLERAEMVVDDTVSKVHQTVTAVHSGILKPVREIQGVAAGVRTAVSVFMRGGRPSVDRATQDDEMFI